MNVDLQVVVAVTEQKRSRVCSTCGSETTYVLKRLKQVQWRRHPITKKWLCHKCYCKFVSDPKRIVFQHKKKTLSYDVRCGVCNLCRAVATQYDAKTLKLITRTHRHHEQYHEDDPLRDTIEICVPCHREIQPDAFIGDDE